MAFSILLENDDLFKAIKQGHLLDVQKLIEKSGRNLRAYHYSDPNKSTTLHVAVRHGHLPIVKYLVLDKKISVNLRNAKGNVPLHTAAMFGRFELVKFLVENGADYNLVDDDGDSAYHYAAVRGRTQVIRYLVGKNKENLNKLNNQGTSPLLSSAALGNVEFFKLLIELGADFRAVDNEGHSALHYAARFGHLNLVKYLVEESKFRPKEHDKGGMNLLHFIVSSISHYPWTQRKYSIQNEGSARHIDVLNYLITELKLDVNEKCGKNIGGTPLHLACGNAELDIVKVLLDLGANCNACDNLGSTPLHCATISENKDEIVKYLIEKCNANINAANKLGLTPLHSAVDSGNLGAVKVLLLRGADCNAVDIFEESVLDHAAKEITKRDSNRQIFRCLITHSRLDLNNRNKNGASPFHLACAFGELQIVKLLLHKGANINAVDFDGDNPLHYAAMMGQRTVVKYFVQKKFPIINLSNNKGETPLDYALDIGDFECIRALGGNVFDNCRIN